MTVFFLESDGKIALIKRREKDVLKGMWQFPNVPGLLGEADARARLAEMGVTVRGGMQKRAHLHVFTHKEWNMTCYYAACDRLPEACAAFTAEEIEERVSLPSAFKWCLSERP